MRYKYFEKLHYLSYFDIHERDLNLPTPKDLTIALLTALMVAHCL